MSAFFTVLVGLIVVVGVIGIATKPTENQLRNAVFEKFGIIYGTSVMAEKLGVVDFTYQDRLVFSTLSVSLMSQRDEVVAYGFFNQILVPGLSTDRSRPTQTSSNRTLQGDDSPATPIIQTQPLSQPPELTSTTVLSSDEIRNGLRTAYPLMKSEMFAAAIDAARQKHPASDFVGSGCVQLSLDTEAFQEVRWSYNGNYQCKMKGAILGISNFDFVVQVKGQVFLKNGTFERSIVRAAAN